MLKRKDPSCAIFSKSRRFKEKSLVEPDISAPPPFLQPSLNNFLIANLGFGWRTILPTFHVSGSMELYFGTTCSCQCQCLGATQQTQPYDGATAIFLFVAQVAVKTSSQHFSLRASQLVYKLTSLSASQKVICFTLLHLFCEFLDLLHIFDPL